MNDCIDGVIFMRFFIIQIVQLFLSVQNIPYFETEVKRKNRKRGIGGLAAASVKAVRAVPHPLSPAADYAWDRSRVRGPA